MAPVTSAARVNGNGNDNGNGSRIAVVSGLFEHTPHRQTERRQNGGVGGPVRVADQHAGHSRISRFNRVLAVNITRFVGSMWCAYAFAAFDTLSLPSAIRAGVAGIVSWIAQTFLQLVLLSIIMVGQNVQAEATTRQAEQTYHDADATLHEAIEIQHHLAVQDDVLEHVISELVDQDQVLESVTAKLIALERRMEERLR